MAASSSRTKSGKGVSGRECPGDCLTDLSGALICFCILIFASTIGAMRRAQALLLLGLFSFALISPALLAADPDSALSACCRRDGKHHCAMETGGCGWVSRPEIVWGPR